MENIAPPLLLLIHVKRSIEKGNPVKNGIISYLNSEKSEFCTSVAKWYSLYQQGQATSKATSEVASIHRRVLLSLLERGLKGEPIYSHLCQMELEIVEASHEEVALKLVKLPFLLMIPLFLMQFPALLLLLFGPILQNFFHSLGGQ